MLSVHLTQNVPKACPELAEGFSSVEPTFAQTLRPAQDYAFGTVRNISLTTKFPETMRVFEELCGTVNNLSSDLRI